MYVNSGPYIQVSRLGNPLFNEVIIPMGKKDYWNTQPPAHDKQFAVLRRPPGACRAAARRCTRGSFPNLAALNKTGKARADLEAILLTGIPAGIIPGFQNFTGATQADMLRLNMAIKPSAKPSIYGLLGGDLAGFPNGRRVFDDVVAVELRALAGVTYALVDKSYTPGRRGRRRDRRPDAGRPHRPLPATRSPTSACRTAGSTTPSPELIAPIAEPIFPGCPRRHGGARQRRNRSTPMNNPMRSTEMGHERGRPSRTSTPQRTDNLLLDIGGDTGALVIHAAAAPRPGGDRDLAPPGPAGARTPQRRAPPRRPSAAAPATPPSSPPLPAGDYVVWLDADTPAGTVTVHGGAVASFRLDQASS